MPQDPPSRRPPGLAEDAAAFTAAAPVTAPPGRAIAALAPIVRGRSVFVIGSAPGASLEGAQDCDLVATVNASLAPFAGLVPDIHFINGFTTLARKPVSARSMALLAGRRARHLFCITRAMDFEAMCAALRAAGFAWTRAHEITAAERRASNERELGRELGGENGTNVASTGISALCLIRQAGAARIRATGFSLHPGHSYDDALHRRGHIPVDSAIFALPCWRGVLGEA